MKKKLIFVLVALTGMGMLIGPVLLGLVAEGEQPSPEIGRAHV